MRQQHHLAVGTAIAAAALVAACSTPHTLTTAGNGGLSPAQVHSWSGRFTTPIVNAAIGGEARMTMINRDSTQIAVQLIGADTASTYPWHIHLNECSAKTGGEFGLGYFQPIHVSSGTGSTGVTSNPTSGTSTAVVPLPMPTVGKYSVKVFASPKDTSLVIACADLVPSMER